MIAQMDKNIPTQIKKFILGQIIMLPLVAAIIKIIHWGGDFFFVYLWFFVLVFTIFMMMVYPGNGHSKLILHFYCATLFTPYLYSLVYATK